MYPAHVIANAAATFVAVSRLGEHMSTVYASTLIRPMARMPGVLRGQGEMDRELVL